MEDAYLGPFGALLGFKVSAMSSEPALRSTLKRVLDGPVYEQRGPRGRRSWPIEISVMDPRDRNMLAALVDGFYGPPPWRFVDPWARVTNLFSPEQALLGPLTYSPGSTLGGAGFTSDGLYFGRSRIVGGGDASLHYWEGQTDRIPVLPNVPVTASVYASGPAAVKLEFVDMFDGFISSVVGQAGSGVMTRRVLTATPPDGAAGCQMTVVNPQSYTLPAFTWTTSVLPWSPGKGCRRATVDVVPEVVMSAHADDEKYRWASTSLTVQELG